MNKQALGLSALGFLLFTAPAFAQQKEDQTGSTYKSEKATKSSDSMKSTTDEAKPEKSTKTTETKSATDTEATKQPAGSDEKAGKTTKTQKKTDTESGSTAKPDKTKD